MQQRLFAYLKLKILIKSDSSVPAQVIHTAEDWSWEALLPVTAWRIQTVDQSGHMVSTLCGHIKIYNLMCNITIYIYINTIYQMYIYIYIFI